MQFYIHDNVSITSTFGFVSRANSTYLTLTFELESYFTSMSFVA